MIRENVGAVIVVEDGRPVGIITEKDVLKRVIIEERDLEQTLVRDVMSSPLISADAEGSIREALDLMRGNDVRRLAVVEDSDLVGITTERRLLEIAHSRYLMEGVRAGKEALYDDSSKLRVAFFSTYPPRECGIATYTMDLVRAISNLQVMNPPVIVAINDKGGHYDYPGEVRFQIDRDRVESYVEAAEFINESDIDIVNLQHEYGLFGGVWGEHIIAFLESVEKPVVTTLHTVLQEPVPEAKRVLEKVLQHSDHAIVMARIGLAILEQIYWTLADKVRYVPHGCPNVPYVGSGLLKPSLGLEGRVVLSTFGLISRGKGIEYAIEALPPIIKEEPLVLYLVIGETHPEVRKYEGEIYRQQLLDLVESLGIEDNVRFVNRFLPKNELLRYLQATDIYIIPYPNKEQISSGTMLYALSTGKAIVTTPFLHAEEVISEDCAVECDFRAPGSIAESVMTMLRDDKVHKGYEERAYDYSRGMIWPNVAMKYLNLFYETLGL
jgi:glycosyltransferase involved in cell wall biosynthesis